MTRSRNSLKQLLWQIHGVRAIFDVITIEFLKHMTVDDVSGGQNACYLFTIEFL
jgi:hypothetical protein